MEACGFYTLWAYTHRPDQEIFTDVNVLKVCFILSLISNALSTSMSDNTPRTSFYADICPNTALIAYRIWTFNREGRDVLRKMRSSTTPVIRIVLESGAVNAAFLFVFVMVVVNNSPSLELVSEMVCL